jgi:hypothetical protein
MDCSAWGGGGGAGGGDEEEEEYIKNNYRLLCSVWCFDNALRRSYVLKQLEGKHDTMTIVINNQTRKWLRKSVTIYPAFNVRSSLKILYSDVDI